LRDGLADPKLTGDGAPRRLGLKSGGVLLQRRGRDGVVAIARGLELGLGPAPRAALSMADTFCAAINQKGCYAIFSHARNDPARLAVDGKRALVNEPGLNLHIGSAVGKPATLSAD
jgi:hypothetical protein